MTAAAPARRPDPFTSNNARVIDQASHRNSTAAEKAEAHAIFGSVGVIEWKKYEGMPGFWRCGFWSFFGFHPRGRSDISAADALGQARRFRLADDPSPTDPSWVPSSYKTPFNPYVKGVA